MTKHFIFLFLIIIFLKHIISVDVDDCQDNECEKVECQPLMRCSDEEELMIQGCACCPSCVRVLQAGQQCIQGYGGPPLTPCASGLRCEEGKCTCRSCDDKSTTTTTTTANERHRKSNKHQRKHSKQSSKH